MKIQKVCAGRNRLYNIQYNHIQNEIKSSSSIQRRNIKEINSKSLELEFTEIQYTMVVTGATCSLSDPHTLCVCVCVRT